MVTAHGGAGIPVRADHLVEEQVAALFERVQRDEQRLDVLVNDISEGEHHDWQPFWKVSLEKGFRALRQGVHSHIITNRCAAPLMVKRRRGLIVEIMEKTGGLYGSWTLAREYGFTDVDGSQPDPSPIWESMPSRRTPIEWTLTR